MRLTKVARKLDSFTVLTDGMSRSGGNMQVLLFLVSISAIVTAAAMYTVENAIAGEDGYLGASMNQFEHAKDFESTPAGLWWAFQALTLRTYGDAKPDTRIGKGLAAAAGICGT